MSSPKVIILVGRPGAGKTTYAESSFAKFLRIDVENNRGDRVCREIYNAVLQRRSIVLDGCNGAADTRADLIEKVRHAHYLICFANRQTDPQYQVECHYLSTSVKASVENLCRSTGKTKRELIPRICEFNRHFSYPDRSEGFDHVHVIHYQPKPVEYKNKALFFHFLSVVSSFVPDSERPSVTIYEDVHETFRQCSLNGYRLIGFVNLDTIAKGPGSHWKAQNCLMQAVRTIRAPIDDIFYCPHNMDEMCGCRTPKPGLILQAQQSHAIDLSQSLIIGNSPIHRELSEFTGMPRYYHRANFFSSFKSLCLFH